MYTNLHEPINACVQFEGKKITPLNFKWGGKIYDSLRLNLVYQERCGQTTITYFCVNDGANYFKLKFNGATLEWWIEETS